MRRPVVLLAIAAGFVLACSSPRDPTTSSASSTTTTDAPCGVLGGPCSQEGATCAPTPIGTGWAHMLQCGGGKWQELEIAPLPQPPPGAVTSSRAP